MLMKLKSSITTFSTILLLFICFSVSATDYSLSSSSITISTAGSHTISGSGSGEVYIVSSTADAVFNITLDNMTLTSGEWSSAIDITNNSSGTMTVNFIIEGTNSITAGNHGGIEVTAGTADVVFTTTTSGTLTCSAQSDYALKNSGGTLNPSVANDLCTSASLNGTIMSISDALSGAFSQKPLVLNVIKLTSASLATVITSAITPSNTSASVTGSVTCDGLQTVTERGIVYSESNTSPVIGGSDVTQLSEGSGTGIFTAPISGLSPQTTYYVSSYAINASGTSYSDVSSFTTTPTSTPPASGDGTKDNPYQIASLENLYWLSQTASAWSSYFIQTADIDASASTTWDGGKGFSPIGNDGIIFTGTYNGKGHTITGLSISRSSTFNIGLFGLVNSAKITNLGIIGGSVTGTETSYVGELIGHAISSSISNCSATGAASGQYYVGGLIGANYGSSVSNCYATGSAVATDSYNGSIGGLMGGSGDGGIITNCYATGTISGSYYIGGLIGDSWGNTISNCFYNTDIFTGSTSDGTGKTTAELQTESTFTDAGWDFAGETTNGSNDYWAIDATKNSGYPYLLWQLKKPTVTTTAISTYDATSATMGGEVTDDGEANVTERGVVYSSTDATPTIGETEVTKDDNETGTGSFSESITGLHGNTTYYVCAYATNSVGTSYGSVESFTTSDSIVYIPDASFKAALVLNYDNNSDGEIQYGEAKTVTKIEVYNENISDLTGIEAFINITDLFCFSNNLTSLDVSKNTALTELDCGSNNLTSLDVSKNTNLQYLFANNCNLTSLDVSKNTALTRLNCNNNSLTSLDLSKNTVLQISYINDNPRLTCVAVDDVAYATNHFTHDSQTTFSTADCGADETWTGNGDEDWFNASNWDKGFIPSAANNVIIAATTTNPIFNFGTDFTIKSLTIATGANLTITSGSKTLTTIGDLTLQSGATYVEKDASPQLLVNGTTTVRQDLTGAGTTTPSGRFWYVASPVTGATSSTFDAAGTNRLWYYDETAHTYSEITNNTTTLSKGTGYVARLGADQTVSFTGTLTSGTVSITPSRTGILDTKRGYNLIGNPYLSYLDWKAATTSASNMLSSLWYRTTTTDGSMLFSTYNALDNVGTNGGTQYIPPMQAFWVKVDADGNTGALSFTNAMRSHQTGLLKEYVAFPVVRLAVSNGTNTDEAVAVFADSASNGFDKFDSPKMSNNNVHVPELYMQADSEKVAINGLRTFTGNDSIAVGFHAFEKGTFAVSLHEFSGLDGYTAVLFDNVTKKSTDLSTGDEYSFVADSSDNASRFTLVLKSGTETTSIKAVTAKGISVSPKNGAIVVTTAVVPATVTISDVLGRVISSSRIASSPASIDVPATGIYFVTVASGTTFETVKVVIQK